MKVRMFLIALIILIGGMAIRTYQAQATATPAAAATVPQADPSTQAAIFAATVQIAMYEHAAEAGGPEPGSRGLGTVVVHGGETLIVTHDHWAHLTPNLNEVEFADAAGRLLLTLDAHAFRALIAYRDGGTMVLRAPAGLNGLAPAPLGAASGEGRVVWYARRAPASGRTAVELVAATVTDVDASAPPASMRLRNLDGSAVIPGDSGGGVWVDGRLAGNLWAAGVREARTFWSDWFGGSQREASDLVVVALQPLTGQAGAVALQADAQPDDGAAGAAEPPVKEDLLQTTLLAE